MSTIIKLQPSAHTDYITEDGTELQKLPYPFFVEVGTGDVQRQDVWRGDPYQVIGFAERVDIPAIDLAWNDVDPTDLAPLVGMYLVTSDEDGEWATHTLAIASAEVTS